MTQSSRISFTSTSSEKPITGISRRRAWVFVFMLACLFWGAVAVSISLAVHAANKARQAEEAVASSQAD